MKPTPSKKPKPQQDVVVQIPLSELHPFPDHPFQAREDACISDDLESLDRERVTTATAKLGALAETHSFFRVLYAKWFYLHFKGFKNNGENVTCALDELRSLPEALPLYQKQIQRFFELVLDIDKAGRISDSEFYSSYIAALGEKLRRARQGMFPCQALRSFSFLLFQSTGIPDPHSMA